MSIPGSVNPLFLGAAGQATGGGEYQIERSVRFNSPDSAYLSRTPGTAGNRRTFTFAAWVKRAKVSNAFNESYFFSCIFSPNNSDSNYFRFGFASDNLFCGLYDSALSTAAVYRDFSAWYHVVLAVDTTQATASNRLKLYVNGSEITAFGSASYPSQNTDLAINSTNAHHLGYTPSATYGHDGYLADIHFIDGQALTPSSFGETDANGVWQPKAFSGTYGTNGFRLPFSDNSAATATTLGKDAAGSNNWTPNNLSVTAGAGNDSLVDTPTSYGTDTGVGGSVRGNYAVLNPLAGSTGTLSNGNLDCSTSATISHRRSTFGVTSGKWYWECTANSASDLLIGIVNTNATFTGGGGYPGGDANGWSYYQNNGSKYNNGGAAYGASYTTGDVIGVALDANAGTLTFYKNGTSQGQAFSGLTNGPYFAAVGNGATADRQYSMNFGQRAFAYTAPSGFKALCDTNLPTPLIEDGSTVMDVALWTGNGAARSISGLGFSPDLVWIKARSTGSYRNALFDIVRGANNRLISDLTNAEDTGDGIGVVSAFNSNGFSLDGGGGTVNETGETYVAWTWDAGTTTASNPDGSITSQVRANVSAGFSIVTWTGNGTAGATVGHGLGVAPGLIIVKQRIAGPGSDLYNWNSYHSSLGATKYIALNKTDAAATAPLFNDTAPTSSVFSLGSSSGTYNNVNNASAVTYVAYCFAPVSGYSSALAWTGNGSADGPLLNCGFSPRFFIAKRTDSANDWWMWDTARSNTGNPVDEWLSPNRSDAEYPNDADFDFLSNGIKIRTTSSTVNASAGTYIGFAWAENPFQYARGR